MTCLLASAVPEYVFLGFINCLGCFLRRLGRLKLEVIVVGARQAWPAAASTD